MALANTIEWEVRTTGNDTNGGGFNTASGGVNYSLQDNPQVAVTDAVTDGTATITSAAASFTSPMEGNLAYVASGTGGIVPDVYEIVSVVNSNTIVVDRSTGLSTGTGATLRVGGALASPGGASRWMKAQHWAFVKPGVYMIGATANVPGGRVSGLAAGSAGRRTSFIGYDINRTQGNTDLNRPTFRAAADFLTIWSGTGANISVENIDTDANSFVNVTGISLGDARSFALRCSARGGGSAFSLTSTNAANVYGCLAENAITGFQGGGWHSGCVARNCSANGYNTSDRVVMLNCVSAFNALAGFALGGAVQMLLRGLTSIGNGTDGIILSGTNTQHLFDSVSYGNGGYALRASGDLEEKLIYNLASGGNTSGRSIGLVPGLDINPITLTADPFVDALNGNYKLNSAAGGGLLLRGKGFPQNLSEV